MGFLTPIVTPLSAPIITVTAPTTSVVTPTITYNQFLNSLGTYNYGSEFFYLHANTFQQINQPFNYMHFDSNGNQIMTSLIFTVDPYQTLPSKYFDTNSEEVIFDGFSSLTFSLLAHSLLYFKMQADIIYTAEGLRQYGEGNTAAVADALDFDFEDYCNYLID